MTTLIDRTLMDLSKYFRAIYYLSNRGKNFFSEISLIFFTVLMVFDSFLFHSIIELFLLLIFIISMILVINLNIKYYIYLLSFIPLFTFLITIPYLFYPFSSGIFVIKFNILNYSTGITLDGLKSSLILVLRTTVLVSSFYFLIFFGGWKNLLDSLVYLKFPKKFVALLSLTYLQIFIIATDVYNMLLAKKSKFFKKISKKNDRILGSKLLTHIFYKSIVDSENLYRSMVSKGYIGEFPIRIRKPNFKFVDFALIIMLVTYSIFVYLVIP